MSGVSAAKATLRAALAGRNSAGDLVDPVTGAVVEMSEARRVARAIGVVRAAAAVPGECGDAIPEAPARGAMLLHDPVELVLDGDGVRRVAAGWHGRRGARVADVFDRMVDQARRAHRGPGFEPPFSWGQVAAARDYAALSERCAAAGVRASSLEMLGGGSGGASGREEAMLSDLQRLRALHRRIGDGLAKEVRRIRSGGRKRVAIRVRRLVDDVCLGGKSLDRVLRDHGWGVDQKSRLGLRAALCSALDRMQGYDLDRPQDVG